MELKFSNDKYRKKALNFKFNQNQKTKEDAFFQLLEGIDAKDLDNLTSIMQFFYKYNGKDLTIEECYGLTQGKECQSIELNQKTKSVIYKLAYFCIEKGKPLGNNTIADGEINTSDWIAHSLYEGKLAGQLAARMGLDVEKATKLGILHDYGRKFIHNSEHIIKGYEALVDKGWDQEAIGCLTHSFLDGKRSSWNDEPEDGFYILADGSIGNKSNANSDDVKLFLNSYEFTKYDLILNISDLMATSYGIVSPAERIIDIAIRRKNIDKMPNRGYFLAELRNKLLELMEEMGYEVPKDKKYELKATSDISLQKIKEEFEDASDLFYSAYQKSLEDGKRIKNYDEDDERV